MNCLTHALQLWHEQGGYLVLRKSAVRSTAHVMHIGGEGLQHYAPGAPLGHPVQALVGYDGVTWDRELADAPPMSLRGIVLSSAIGFFGVLCWAVKRKLSEVRRG